MRSLMCIMMHINGALPAPWLVGVVTLDSGLCTEGKSNGIFR